MITGYDKVLEQVQSKISACGRHSNEVTVIAVSKSYPLDCLEKVYQEGARDFGESRLQEALHKIPLMPSDCRWHLIGSLQNKKVAKAVSSFTLIHSVDTPDLAQKISMASQNLGRETSILLQVNTSGETAKHGLSADAWKQALTEVNLLPYLRIEGLMTMAPLTEDEQIIRSCFRELRLLRDDWRSHMKDPAVFNHLSMGMSNDYLIAIEEGATLLRIGTAIFALK